ncbi:MAG: PaaI family thioesterase [Desulfobacula sp.]|uniref:PaaI family thioesterase n=1 Tax=Desulfobacula sp. TaxID=2593537 RepID=UPI0025BB9427|nr:PaaI family thioesterase [Desulfobacula sp.]MCD4719556.1 PaaI family thioesterase [Desulfobacula sp.]
MENIDRKRTIVWEDPKNSARDAASISGLDYLKSIKDGRINPPPVAMLVGYKISEVDNGYAVFELNPEEYHYNPFSTVHGGIITTLLDTTITASVLSTLQKGISCSTVEIKVNFIRSITAKTKILRCEAKPIHIGKRLATAEGRLKDKNGNLYAHGISTCSIFKIRIA